MTALTTLLDDLDAKAKAATPGPWDTGDGVCGPYLSFKGHPSGGGIDEPYDDGSEPLWLGGSVTESDRKCIVAAVNAAPTLIAVVRAAMERPWVKVVDDDVGGERWLKCRVCFAAVESDHGHNRGCPMAPLDAALDAAEAEVNRG